MGIKIKINQRLVGRFEGFFVGFVVGYFGIQKHILTATDFISNYSINIDRPYTEQVRIFIADLSE